MPAAWCRTRNCSSVTSKCCRLIIGQTTIKTMVSCNMITIHSIPCLFRIHFNTLLPSISRSTKWSHSFSFPKKPFMYLFSLIRTTCLAHLVVLWTHGGTADSGTALQARRLQVWFLMELVDFSTWSFWLHYASGVDSESNRNEYQEYLLEGKGSWCTGLTTLPPLYAVYEFWRPQPPAAPTTCPGLYRDGFTDFIILDWTAQTISSKQYTSWSTALCSFVQSPVTSALLCLNISLSTLLPIPLSAPCSPYLPQHPAPDTSLSTLLPIPPSAPCSRYLPQHPIPNHPQSVFFP